MTDHTPTPGNSLAVADPVQVLSRMRPDPPAGDEWDSARSNAVLVGILATGPDVDDRHRRASRHRRLVVGGAIAACAAAAVAGVALPGGSPGGPDAATAATLDRLAVVAGTAGRPVGDGQYAYLDSREVQKFSAADVARGTPPITSHTFRTWTARSGDSWRLRGRCLQRWPHDSSATTAGGNYAGVDAAQYAALPTVPSALADYVDQHPDGDNRGTLNRFVAVGDIVGDGLAGPRLRAAAIRVLARTDGITVRPGSHDVLGRTAIEVDYGYSGGAVSSLYFAPQTSALLETQTRENGRVDYREVLRASRVVGALPRRPDCG